MATTDTKVDSPQPGVLLVALPNTYSQRPDSSKRSKASHAWAVYVVNLLGLLGLLYFAYTYWSPDTQERPCTESHSLQKEFAHRDAALNHTRRELLHLDIEIPPYWAISDSINIGEALDICDYSWNASGTLKLVPGDSEQKYNFMIGIDVAGSSQEAVDSVGWYFYTGMKGMFIRCIEFPGEASDDKPHWDASVRVDVMVFVKPHSLQFGRLGINLDVLDIEIAQGLAFETYHMDLYTTSGDIMCAEPQQFTAHEISVVTRDGSITGNWSLPGSIALRTGVGDWKLEGGPIDINLIPKRWSSGPQTGGMLSTTTVQGNIDIRTPLGEKELSLRNMSIDLHSHVGSIFGTYVTGIHTSMTTVAGSIDAILLPYFALPDTCSLTTSTAAGDTSIRVLPPVIDSYYGIDPLKNTKSEHTVRGGNVHLYYPYQWVGAALGLSETGNVSISGSHFRTIEQWEHMVVARTDDMLASRLDFSTTTGNGELVVE